MHAIFGEDLMKKARLLVTGLSVGLCLGAIAKADDDQVPTVPTVATRVIVKRVIVVRGREDRVIYVRSANGLHSITPANRSFHSTIAPQNRRRDPEASTIRDGENRVAQTTNSGRSGDKKQPDQQDAKDTKSVDREADVKQPDGTGALDRLTVQAQKEQATRLTGPTNLDK
jgi:hypothetical protein